MVRNRHFLCCCVAAALLIHTSGARAQSPTALGAVRATAHQSVLDRPANLTLGAELLETALARLTETSGVTVAFSPSLIAQQRARVSCECAHVSVDVALHRLLRGTSLQHFAMHGQVVIHSAPPPEIQPLQRPIQYASLFAHNAPRMIDPGLLRSSESPVASVLQFVAGRVLNQRTGEPVARARVAVEGTDLATIADVSGSFRIEGVSGDEVTVRVQHIGYRDAVQIVRTGDATVQVLLVESAIRLDEVVVTGTAGGAERRAIANAVSTIDIAEIKQFTPATDMTKLMAGRAAGVVVRAGSGAVAGGARINVRGHSSLTLNDQPLIYVDGVRVDNAVGSGPESQGVSLAYGATSRLDDFNPDDIERIEVIKGPAAATLYGTEASNGVIHIITKRGRAGTAAQWELSTRHGAAWFDNPAGRFPTQYWRDAQGQLRQINFFARDAAEGIRAFRTGRQQGYSLNVSGGTETMQYYIAGKFDDDQGIYRNDSRKSIGGRANLTATPSAKLVVTGNFGYTRSTADIPGEGPLAGAISTYLTVNSIPQLETPRRGYTVGSPVGWQEVYKFGQEVDRTTGGFQLTHRPTEWFTQRLSFGLDYVQENNEHSIPFLNSQQRTEFGSGIWQGRKRNRLRNALNTTLDFSGTATRNLTERITSNTAVGLQYYRNAGHHLWLQGTSFPAPGLNSIAATATAQVTRDELLQNATVGAFVQEQISFQDRLFMTGALRADDNSAFGENFDLVYYPKGSVTWVLSEEPMWRVSFFNTLRLRAAYGQSGLQPGAFDAIRLYQSQTAGDGSPTVTPLSMGNADLAPERSDELELGFDAGLFNDRVGIEFTYYSQRTNGAIVQRSLPPSSGFVGSQFVNLGKLKNWGFEVLLNASVLQARNVGVDLRVNIGTHDSKVIDLGDELGADFLAVSNFMRHQEGHPLGAWFGRKVIQSQFDADGALAGAQCDNGNGQPVDCANAPDVFLGRSTPTANGSVGLTLTVLRQLKLHALVDFQQGLRMLDGDSQQLCEANRSCRELFFVDGDRNRTAAARLRIYPFFGLSDASFFRMREVALAYSLPGWMPERIGARRASVSVALRNTRIWTNYSGLDPEGFVLGAQWEATSRNNTPLPMAFQTRMNVTF